MIRIKLTGNDVRRLDQAVLSAVQRLCRKHEIRPYRPTYRFLRVYVDPTAREATRSRAMDVFDRLMERFAAQAHAILDEWDRR